MTHANERPEPSDTPHASELESLVSRAVDGTATRTHWRRIEALAGTDQTIWRTLALSHRDHTLLSREVSHASLAADQTELPSAEDTMLANLAESGAHDGAQGGWERSGRMGGTMNFRAWGGWAAAAVLTLALVIQGSRSGTALGGLSGGIATNTHNGGAQSGTQTAGLFSSAADVLSAYLQRGHEEGSVLGEVPEKMLVQSVPAEQGNGYEVIFVRQIVERAHVPDLYRFSQDEQGKTLPVRVRVGVPMRAVHGAM